jgi:hypothetical protein
MRMIRKSSSAGFVETAAGAVQIFSEKSGLWAAWMSNVGRRITNASERIGERNLHSAFHVSVNANIRYLRPQRKAGERRSM